MRSFSASKRLFIILSILAAVVTVFSFQGSRINLGASAESTRLSFAAGTLSATKTGALDAGGDANGNGAVNPGDRLKYQIVINNSGADAAGVNLSDTIDANTTYVAGSIIASPVAVNESYSAIGNVNISVPASSGLLANDLNPNGNGTLTITTAPTVSTNGGIVSVNTTTGAFTYNPPVGFEGADTFTYTLSNGTGLTDTATVTINVSGMIWFVNNNSGACASSCDGRLSNPFTTLAAFNAANTLNGGFNPDNNDNIFIYESATQYTGTITLRTGQKLIGQDAGATLAAITGLTAQSYSAALPAMNNSNATITNIGNTVTLNTNATLRGFSINSTANTGINDPASAITGVNTSEVNVATTTGTAILLSSAGGTLSFTKISANGAANGISLTNTIGSFTITGSSNGICGGMTNIPAASTAPNAADCTGGHIQNTVGADGSTAGNGIYLNNAQNVSLTRIQVSDNQNNGIYGTAVRGLTISHSLFNGNNGTSNSGAFLESSVHFADLGGAVSVTDSYLGGTVYSPAITGSAYDHFVVTNTSGTAPNLTLTFSNNTLGTMQGSTADVRGSAFQVIAGDGTISVNASNNEITYWWGNAVQVAVQGTTASGTAAIRNNRVLQTSGALAGAGGIEVNGGNLAFDISGNRVAFTDGTAISADKNQGNTYFNGTINNNQVGYASASSGPGGLTPRGTAWASNTNSGSAAGTGIFAQHAGPNATTIKVTNNTIRQVNGSQAMWMLLGDDVGGGGSGTFNTTVTGNNIAEEGSSVNSARTGIIVQSGRVTNDTDQMCADVSTNSITNFNNRIRPNQRFNTVMRMPGYTGAANDNIAVNNYLTARNPGTVNVTSTSTAGGGGIFNTSPAGSACPQPTAVSIASLIFESELKDENFAGITPATIMEKPSENAARVSGNIYSALNNIVLAAENIRANLLPTTYAESRNNAGASVATLSGETVAKALGALPAGESITVQFTATVNSIPANFYSVSNTANITAAGGISINSTTATNTVVQPPSIAKAFGASFVATGGTTSLTYTITNANAAALNGLAFSDTLPAGLVINTPNGLNNTCGGTITATQNTSVISLAGGSVAANTSCTVKIDVKVTTEGAKTSATTVVNSTNGGAGNSASATLNVINAPTFTQSFGAATVQLNGSTTLSFTITNASLVFPLSNVSFTNTLPAGLVISTPANQSGSCSGTISADAGSGAVSLSGATLAANTNCTFSVNVTGTTAGLKNNTVTLSTIELGSTPTATASVTVVAAPTISKNFSSVSIVAGGASTVTLTLSNSNTTGTLTGASFSDTLVNMTAAGGAVGGTCAGTTPNALSAGATNLSFSGITIPNNGNCTITFTVASTSVGTNPNTTSGVTSNQTPVAGTPSNTANLMVIAPADLTITKSHAGNFTQGDTNKTYSIVVTNSGGTATSGTTSVTDTLPAGLTATAISGSGWNCALGILNCTRSDVLPAGNSYPAIILTVNVANNAPASVTNTATVSGGGETNTANNTANDPTTIDSAAAYTISGQVTNGGAALEGVGVALSGASAAMTVTDASGNYSFSNLASGGNYTVTPSLNGYVFSPANTPVNNLTGNQSNISFATTNASYEADAAPRPTGDGDGTVNGGDLTIIRRFVAGIETPTVPALGSEFQRVDCAPLYDSNNNLVKGDGSINGGDITQVRRFAAGLDAVIPAGGPATPTSPPSNPTGNLQSTNNLYSAESILSAPNLLIATRDVRPVKANLIGNVLTVAVNLNTDAAEPAANTVDFTLLYDSAVLSNPTNIRNGANAPAATTITPNTAQAGKVGIVLDLPVTGATTTFPTGDAQLVLVDFTVAANPPANTTIGFGASPVAEFVGDINGNRLTTTFSPASLSILGPTAASVTVGGRVLTEKGRGINNVVVTLTDLRGQIRTARTNPFGYYRFTDVVAGETYLLTAKGKQFAFSESPQVLSVNEDNFDVNFIGHSGRYGSGLPETIR